MITFLVILTLIMLAIILLIEIDIKHDMDEFRDRQRRLDAELLKATEQKMRMWNERP